MVFIELFCMSQKNVLPNRPYPRSDASGHDTGARGTKKDGGDQKSDRIMR